MIKLILAVIAAAAAVLLAPSASANPGQCMQTPWGGFCDQPMNPDGTYYHCENAMGFANCFYVRPVDPSIDPRGWVPA